MKSMLAVLLVVPSSALLIPVAPRPALQTCTSSRAGLRMSTDDQRPAPPALLLSAPLVLLSAQPAAAATANAIPSALAAYGHYLGLVLVCLCLATERLTVKENMTAEEEDRIAIADAIYGVAGLLVLYTGYLPVTVYGKGWEFYSHEPIFWLKMTLVAVMGAASFFPTTKMIQRSIAKRNNNNVLVAPMSEKLASRMASIMNAELLAIATIPATAAFMARGVGYAEWLPWQAGAAPVALCLFGLGYKYVKEALDWQE